MRRVCRDLRTRPQLRLLIGTGVENRCLATGWTPVFSLCLPTAHGWTRVLALLADGTRASQLGHPRRRHKPPINARAITCIALSIRGGIDLEFLGEAIVGWY